MLDRFNSSAHHVGRPLMILFAAGMIAGSVLLAPHLGTLLASATGSRAVSCGTAAFQPISSDTTFTIGSARVLYRFSSGGSGSFRCEPALPHNAVVTKFQVTGADYSGTGEMGMCALRRMSLLVATAGDSDVLASTAATGVAAAPGVVRLTDTTISFATVNATQFAYYIQCELGTDPSAGPIGATVTFHM